ncbi:MAG: MarP family serine protease [Marmoricola sp.]
MNALDWVLILLALLYALSGYWQGLIAGAFATLGLLFGGVIGVWVAPWILGSVSPSIWVSLTAIVMVLFVALVGQAAFQMVGVKARNAISWQPIRALDAVGGSVLSAVAVLVVAWALGVAVSGADIPGLSTMVRSSSVLSEVNSLMPQSAQQTLRAFDRVVGTQFPRYLEPFAQEDIVSTEPPPPGIGRDAAVVRAGASVYRVLSNNSCGQGIEGTAFLYAPGHLMTNAHVVAGVRDPNVKIDGQYVSARVVYYNPDLDIAVLSVPSLRGPYLRFDRNGSAGEAAAVLGYPENGPYNVQPARIRADQRLRSPDIYGNGAVVRDVFSVRGKIRPGNSGGPLVSAKGQVLGVVFAASVTDSQTGYALTADQVSGAAAQGLTSSQTVGTGGCA